MDSKRQENLQELVRLVAIVEGELAALPTFTWETRAAHTSALTKVREKLERSETARFGERGGSTTIELCGTRSSSTMGVQFALKNWVKAAQARLGTGEAK
jgi:hypothetical protein